MPRIMYCTAVRRIGETFSSRPNISIEAQLGIEELMPFLSTRTRTIPPKRDPLRAELLELTSL
jgi:hypothetical protein